MRDGVAHLDFHGGFDAGDDVAHVAGFHLPRGVEAEFEVADFLGLIFVAGGEELHLVTFAEGAVHDFKVSDDAAESIEHRVEDKRLQRGLGVSFGCGNLVHDGVQDSLYAFARPGADPQDILRFAAQQVYNLVRHHFRLGGIHVNLVEDRDNFQIMVNGLIQVGNRLCLNTLRCIDYQQGPLAGSDAAGHFIAEVHMAGRINQVEAVSDTVPEVIHLDGVALDGNALLPLQVHVVQYLVFHFPVAERAGQLQQPVRQCGLPMVDMCDDAKIADILHNLQRYAKCRKMPTCSPACLCRSLRGGVCPARVLPCPRFALPSFCPAEARIGAPWCSEPPFYPAGARIGAFLCSGPPFCRAGARIRPPWCSGPPFYPAGARIGAPWCSWLPFCPAGARIEAFLCSGLLFCRAGARIWAFLCSGPPFCPTEARIRPFLCSGMLF